MAIFSPSRILAVAAQLCLLISLTQAAPLEARSCFNPKVRKEWRSLTTLQKLNYIRAVKCMMAKPPQTSTTDLPGVTNRYEDFLGTHIAQADAVHFVGVFYPFHRLMLHTYEIALQECGYFGGQPYWDWTLDTVNPGDLVNSPIFNKITGFGGNGAYVPGNVSNPEPGLFVGPPWDIPDRTGGGCITDGPFANTQTHMGPGANLNYNPHCIRRDFAPITLKNNSGSASVAVGMSLPDYGTWEVTTEFSFHPGGHWGIGGLYGNMGDKWASPSDPLFYLHHANVDRAWWSWQQKNPSVRLTDISGPLIPFDFADPTPGANVTLSTPIHIGSTVNVTTTVGQVMNIKGGILCYDYDHLYV